MKYLGIDYGTKRVGIATSDECGDFAFPYAVLVNDKNLTENIKKICEKEGVSAIVMGESLDYKGKENAVMKKILLFKKESEEELKLPIFLEPEFLTSAEAEHIQGKNKDLDASAAALILKNYLDRLH